MPASPVIDVERLNVTYGDFHAVKDLSFQVRRGELYALLGTNGAGKTSTLEVVEGHRTATSGTVRVFGQSPRDRRAVRPRMGIMLQESGFSPDLTVRESVRLIGKLTQRTDDVDRVLGVVDLTRKAGTKVSQLSGGEKRRLDFATAVYGAPELIFLDEPTTGLDIQSRDDLWDAVDRLREDGSTIVLTTHYLEEAQQRADRIGLMHRGHLPPGGDRLRADADPARRHPLLPAGRPHPRCRCGPPARATGSSSSRPSTCRRTCTPCSDWAQDARRGAAGTRKPDRPGSTTSSAPSTTSRPHSPELPELAKKGTFAMLSIALSELIQIFRNRLVLVTSLIMPVVVSAFFIYQHEDVRGPGQPRLHRGDRDVHRGGVRALHHHGDHPGLPPAEPLPQAAALHRGRRRRHPLRAAAARSPSSRWSRWP